MPEEGIRDI